MNARTLDSPIPLRADPGAIYSNAFRSVVRAVLAKSLGVLDRDDCFKVAERAWPNDRDVPLILRAATAPTTLASAASLATVAVAFVSALTPVSAGAALLARGLGVSFDGAAQINVPNLTLPLATFVPEGAPIPVVQGTTAGVSMSPAKLATIVTLMGEMIRHSNAEAVVRQVLLDATGPGLDAVLFDANAAVAETRPARLLHGVAPLNESGVVGTKQEAMADDITALAAPVAPVAGNGSVVLIAAAEQATRLGFAPRMPFTVLVSSSLAAGTVIAVATNAVGCEAQSRARSHA